MNDLKMIANEIVTQDDRLTESPIFILFDRKKIPTSCKYSDKFFYFDSPNDCTEIGTTLEELIKYCREYEMVKFPEDFDSFDDWKKEDFILSKTDIEKIYYLKVNEYKQAFFTEKSAKEFLERNSHHFEDPLIWCDSLYRNDEMQAIRNALIEGRFQS